MMQRSPQVYCVSVACIIGKLNFLSKVVRVGQKRAGAVFFILRKSFSLKSPLQIEACFLASQNSICTTNATPIYPPLTRATAVVIPERTPPLYVLKGAIGGASPPTEKKALHAKPPPSRNTHRLLCPSRNGENMSPVAYESSSSLNLNAHKSEEKPKMDALCLDEIASANNYLRMSKRNKSGTLRLSIPTLPATTQEHQIKQNAALPPKPPRDFRRRTMHGWCFLCTLSRLLLFFR